MRCFFRILNTKVSLLGKTCPFERAAEEDSVAASLTLAGRRGHTCSQRGPRCFEKQRRTAVQNDGTAYTGRYRTHPQASQLPGATLLLRPQCQLSPPTKRRAAGEGNRVLGRGIFALDNDTSW